MSGVGSRAVTASALIAVAILMLSMSASAVFAQQLTTVQPVVITYYCWGTPSSQLSPAPGAVSVPFTVEAVVNPTTGGAPTTLSYATLNVTGTPLTNSTGGYVATAAPAAVGSNAYYFTFYLDISGNATPSAYNSTLDVYYGQTHTSTSSSGTSTTVDYYVYTDTLSVGIYQRPTLNVTVTAPTLYVGRTGTLVVDVKNAGTASVQDLGIGVQSQLPLVSGSTGTLGLGTLTPGSGESVSFGILAAQPPGYYPVQVTVSYEYMGVQYASVYYANADVIEQVGGIYAYASPSSIPYQRNDTLSLYLVNGFSGGVGNVEVTLQPSSYFYVAQGYGPFQLGSIAPGGSASLNLSVIPLASSPGPASLQLEVSYLEGGTQEQTTISVPVYLEGQVSISFSQVAPSGALYPGSSAQISGIVLNTGTSIAYYGSAYVNGSIVQGAQPTYVGNLPTNSPTPFSVSFSVPPGTAPGTYVVNVVFSYQDELGHIHAASYPLYVDVVSAPPATPSSGARHGSLYESLLFMSIIILIIIIAALSFVLLRRRRPASP